MTHRAFAQAVMDEWLLTPIELLQTCWCQWYLYSFLDNGKNKIVGKYTLIDSKPMFVLIKRDGTKEHMEVTE